MEKPADELIDVFADVSQKALEQIASSDLLAGLPGIGTVVTVARLHSTISDRIFLKKVQQFLKAADTIAPEAKAKFIHDHVDKPEKRQKLSDTLTLAIDAIDDFDKSERIAWVFVAYANGEIELDVFRRLVRGLTIAFIDDIKAFEMNVQPPGFTMAALVPSGLTELQFRDVIDRLNIIYASSQDGTTYRKIAFARLGIAKDASGASYTGYRPTPPREKIDLRGNAKRGLQS